MFTYAMKNVAHIHIITNRERTPESEQNTKEQLQNLGIHYDHLIITSEKTKYILENGVSIYFDDTDEYYLDLPETVAVFKIRESWNFDFMSINGCIRIGQGEISIRRNKKNIYYISRKNIVVQNSHF